MFELPIEQPCTHFESFTELKLAEASYHRCLSSKKRADHDLSQGDDAFAPEEFA